MDRDHAPQVSRYRLGGRLGAGGLGVVYEAHDPKLDREVAIKLLRLTNGDDRALERLRREATALARVNHPNVVPVFDVGAYAASPEMAWPPDVPRHGVYLVMELVRGPSLRRWLETHREPERVVRAFIQAGRGVAAAHSVGLTHRDFKPANAVVGEDGTVKVLDFGIAKWQRADHGRTSSPELGGLATMDTLDPMTTEGSVVGTPAYMAPEQHVGGDVDARSDQYAFCIALAEGLCGTRPFPGRTMDELYQVKERMQIDARVASIPPRLWAIIERGLSFHPDQRWPSMEALLGALEHGLRRPWWQPASVAAVGVGLGLFGGWLLWPGPPPEPLAAAVPAEPVVPPVLDPVGHAPSVAASRLRRDAEAAWASTELATLAALVPTIDGDAQHDDPSLTAESLIWRARVSDDAMGAELCQRAFFLAKEADVPSVAARAAAAMATAVVDDHGQAMAEWVRHAWVEAEREPWDRGAAIEVAVTAAYSRAIAVADPSAADLLHFAAAVVGGVELDDGPYVAYELSELASGFRFVGEAEQALYWSAEAIALLDAIAPPDHPLYGMVEREIGVSLKLLRRCDEAMPHLDRSLAILLTHPEPELHAEAILVHKHAAECLTMMKRYPQAIDEYRRMLAQSGALGADATIQTFDAHRRIAQLLVVMERRDEARREYEAALAIFDDDAPDHGLRATALAELAALDPAPSK